MSILNVSNLRAGYDKKDIINNVSFSVNEGELVAVLGANGSGKTTLVKAICGMIPHSGECSVSGESVDKLKAKELARMCSYIPQQSGISIDISVINVVLMGFNPYLGLLQYPTARMKEKAYKVIEQVGLKGKAEDNYLSLSEGQKQLCILARAMVADSRLLLMDEPESALDFNVRYNVMEYIRSWISQETDGGKRAALVTLHDTNLALNYCDRLLLINDSTIADTVNIREDDISVIQEKLRIIYGSISIQSFTNKNGDRQLVMVREPE